MIVPQNRPKLQESELDIKLVKNGYTGLLNSSIYPLLVIGIRGYYKRTMGSSTINDRNIYDDAIFVRTESAFVSFNANTDPSKWRRGIANLCPGFWNSYRLDLHKGKYLALCQRGGVVTVMRDSDGGGFLDTGYFGINIHRGGWNTTSSEGCQTIHPSQWDSFIALVTDQAKMFFGNKWKRTNIPYVLIEE